VTGNVASHGNPDSRPTTRPVAFHAWLREVAGLRGLSGGTLARQIGAPTNRVYGWLLGVYQPDEADVPALAEALGVTIGEVRRALGGQSATENGVPPRLPTRSNPDPTVRRSAPPVRRG
jgi:hypothetical protein